MTTSTPNREPIFAPSDVWVLLAVAFACRSGDGATLKDVIAAGDGVQRVVFSGAELRRAMSKLTHVGYVAESGGVFRLSGEARDLWIAPFGQGEKSRWWHDTFERLLNPDPDHTPSNPFDDDPDWTYHQITDESVDVAAKQYGQEFCAAFEALRSKS